MTLMNQAASADRLVAVTTEAAANAELHQSVEENGVARMLPVDSLEIPAGGSVELKPGGYHIMLMGLKAPLKKGDVLMLQLKFEHAGMVEVMADVGDVAEGHAHTEDSPGN
jgi:copper(I)-binding protein